MSLLRDALLNGSQSARQGRSLFDDWNNPVGVDSDVSPDTVKTEPIQNETETGKSMGRRDMILEGSLGYEGLPSKEAKAIQEDFRMCKQEIDNCEAMMESLQSAPERNKSEKLFKQRQVNAVTKKKLNKVEHLKRLNARLKALHEQHNKTFQVPSTSSAPSSQPNSTPLSLPFVPMVDISNASTGSAGASNSHTMLVTPPIQNEPADAADEEKKSAFHVDRSRIQAIGNQQQDAELQQLGLTVYNQDEFEQGVIDQVDEALAAEEEMRLNKVMEKEMKAIQDDVRSCQQEINRCEKVLETLNPNAPMSKETRRSIDSVNRQKANKTQHLKRLKARQKALYQRMVKSIHELDGGITSPTHQPSGHATSLPLDQLTSGANQAETEEERMVRLGEMTPFGTVVSQQEPSTSKQMSSFEKYLMDQNVKVETRRRSKAKPRRSNASSSAVQLEKDTASVSADTLKKSKSASRLKGEGNFFDAKDKRVYRPAEKDFSNYTPRKRRIHPNVKHNFSGDRDGSDVEHGDDINEDDYDNQFKDESYIPPHDRELDMSDDDDGPSHQKKRKNYNRRKTASCDNEVDLGELKAKYGVKKKASRGGKLAKYTKGLMVKDDGTRQLYQRRLKTWRTERLKQKHACILLKMVNSSDESDMEFDGGFKVPNKIWKKLYRYQKTGVKWLWELHAQQCGGIVGDEMGLGKTIQVIAFLVALKNSQLRDKGVNQKYVGLGPVIVVCPITVMHQWVREFHKWWPEFRVAILHSSGAYSGRESQLVREIVADNGVLITSYTHTVIHQDLLLQYDWHYIVLDEGHKIRNPDAQVTLAVKQFRTCHRLILSGSPMQNNLKELWSLFDFVFPGKLGTLPDFMAHFSVPITFGGYANATQVQVTTAYKCACILRDTINPYLLRRVKNDVKVSLDLPQKNEQVLFCRLTQHQRDVYQEYLDSKECHQILSGNYMVFPGLITLRKVCNHPDLSTGGPTMFDRYGVEETDPKVREYGHYSRSGKLMVVESLLKIWKRQGHRVLLFTQGTQMMDILEKFVVRARYTYMRMDGQTSISSRQPLITKFNQDQSIFLFLLTTRVGGLGVNLTGADRVVIFDPDWNPSTDTQAKERAWRIGQTKQVTIYRLITTGTIEEKIYHRQIFKQFLTNRVLKDPKQRRFFKSNDLYELFTLGDDDLETGTETSAIFAGTGSDVKVKLKPQHQKQSEEPRPKRKNRFDLLREESRSKDEEPDIDTSGNDEMDWDKEKLDRMKELARRLSQQISASKISKTKNSTEAKDTNTEDQTAVYSAISMDNADNANTNYDTFEKSDNGLNSRSSVEKAGNSSDQPVLNEGIGSCTSVEKQENTSAPLALHEGIDSFPTLEKPENTSAPLEPHEDIGVDLYCSEGSTDEMKHEDLCAGSTSQSQDLVLGCSTQRKRRKRKNEAKKRREKRDQKRRQRRKQKEMEMGSKLGSNEGKELGKEHGKEQRKEHEKEQRKEHRKERKKERRMNDAYFEGQRVSYLARHGTYQSRDSGDEKPSNDDFVLQKLFSKSGVHSAIQHDTIMQSSDPDYALVEGEAERVAQEAARALRASRQACNSASSGMPTWTGSSGTLAKPRFGQKKNSNLTTLREKLVEKKEEQKKKATPVEQAPLFAPDPVKSRHFDGSIAGSVKQKSFSAAAENNMMSSAELMRKMRSRNFAATQDSADGDEDSVQTAISAADADPVYLELITDIRNFIAFCARVDGQASTQELLDEFGSRLPPEDSAKFKAMLKQLCTLSKDTGVGIWRLKPEFR